MLTNKRLHQSLVPREMVVRWFNFWRLRESMLNQHAITLLLFDDYAVLKCGEVEIAEFTNAEIPVDIDQALMALTQKENSMLVLSRRVGESIVIDNNIKITVLRDSGGQVRIGIDAPKSINVVRSELLDPDHPHFEARA